jgi:hypothetical protein
MHPTLSLHMVLDHTYLTRSTHSNLSHSHQQSWAGPGSWHNPQHAGWPICGSVPSFSPKTAIEVVQTNPIIYWRSATRLTGPISPVCDRYVQYLLTGVNPSVLNQHRRGLQPPKGPARSQVIQSQHSLKWKWCEITITDSWSFDHSTSIEVYIYA